MIHLNMDIYHSKCISIQSEWGVGVVVACWIPVSLKKREKPIGRQFKSGTPQHSILFLHFLRYRRRTITVFAVGALFFGCWVDGE
jgi:hypothetical protein